MKNLKTRIAAAATILGLGGLTGVALNAGAQKSPPVAEKPLVRTKVIRRTVHVTKHANPKHPVGAGGGCRPDEASSTGFHLLHISRSGDDLGERCVDDPLSAPHRSGSAPVVTHTSGSTAGSGGGLSLHVGWRRRPQCSGRHPHQRLFPPRLGRRVPHHLQWRLPRTPVVTQTSGSGAGSTGGNTVSTGGSTAAPVVTHTSGAGGAVTGGDHGERDGGDHGD